MVSLCKSSKIRHLYRKLHNRKRRNSTRKSCIKFRFWQKTRFTHAIAPNKRANSHDLETDLNLLTITFHLLTEQSYTSFINSRWKWVTLSVRSLTVFKEKILVTDIELKFVCQTSASVLKRACAFFLTRSLIDRYHIVTDTFKKSVLKPFWKPFKSPFPLHKKNIYISVKPLFNLH